MPTPTMQGHVEDFGMRSTKIRLVKDGEAMHVPNSKLACSMVINGDDIKSRRIQLDVWLAGDTSHAVLVKFITGLSDDLEEHESITRSAAHYMDMDPTLGILLEVQTAR
jgi:small-conductance mechanosensitive channel